MATDLNNLAQLLKATNRLAEAEPSMRRALAIFADSLGPDHPSTRRRRNLEALLAEIEGAKAHLPGGPLTRPRGGHPLPPRRGLFARMFGRR